MFRRRIIACAVILSSLCQPAAVASDESRKICVGYDFLNNRWGFAQDAQPHWIECPPGFAFFGVGNPMGSYRGNKVEVFGNCCPLAADDILTGEQVITEDSSCPDEYVVTGLYVFGWRNIGRRKDDQVRPIRCTRINGARYALGPPSYGLSWGVGRASAFPWKERKIIRRDEVPIAIRFGLSRGSRDQYFFTGCAGDPIGSLLWGKVDSSCGGLLWREVLIKSGDASKAGKALQMIPECRSISNPYDIHASCSN